MPVAEAGETVVYAKPLEDGTLAVGLFNRGVEHATIGFTPRSLGMWGEKSLRDVWRQQDIGVYSEKEHFEATAPPRRIAAAHLALQQSGKDCAGEVITPSGQRPSVRKETACAIGRAPLVQRCPSRVFRMGALPFTDYCVSLSAK